MLIDLRRNKGGPRKSRSGDVVRRRNQARAYLNAMSTEQLRRFAHRHSISLPASGDRRDMVSHMISQWSSWGPGFEREGT